MNTLKIGDKIPEFDCLDNNGNNVSSGDFAGKKLIVFFYPRANTPGCTAEACNFSENYKESRKDLIKLISQLDWSNGFFRSDIGYKVIDL